MSNKSPSTPAQLPALLQKAINAHQAGLPDKAMPLYQQFLEQESEHPTALQLTGLLHSQLGEYEPAIELMSRSLKLFPEQAEVANNLANALSACERSHEAIECYLQAVKIKPAYAEAWRNLGLTYIEIENSQAALDALKQCLKIQPDDAVACLGLSNIFKAENELDQAIQCLGKAIEFRPDYAEAHHNMGVCLRMQGKSLEAMECFEKARALGLDRAEIYQNLASVQVDRLDMDNALENYRKAITRDPEDLASHRSLNSLLFQLEREEEYLQSYQQALLTNPKSQALALAYGMALNQGESFEKAEEVLSAALVHAPESSELKSLLAYTFEGQGDWTRALQTHANAVSCADTNPNHGISYARALLAREEPEKALVYAQKAADDMPFNQRAIAYLGLCWRMLENEADAFINDYENLVQVYDIPISERYSDAAEFNRNLMQLLDKLHVGRRHPPEQTLRGGTQTHGDLLDRREPEIQELKAGLSACVQDYISKLADHSQHPLLMRKSDRFSYSASWSVRLHAPGYHTMHVHPLGWISSAYYVHVPTEVSESDEHGGGIKFGEPDIDLGWRGLAVHKIQPQTGRLVLFPSYMWHGTVPFESNEPRTTVAFDVVPVHD
ncbi:MAG: tetratricopeptide repeat protein [Gammaproteobacteria bacterium]|nr:tetratricopeptide repeat protein [Gammaproteobacteria bacterium]